MKYKHNDKDRINIHHLINEKLEGNISLVEFMFYITLRSHAYPEKKTGERNVSILTIKQIEELFQFTYSQNRIRTILSGLTRSGLIKPQYYVKTSKGYEIHTSIRDFDKPGGLGRRRIAFARYKIVLTKSEKKLRKETLDS